MAGSQAQDFVFRDILVPQAVAHFCKRAKRDQVTNVDHQYHTFWEDKYV
jgi:hypothetical protein